jgi:hypothetical protein
MAFMIEQWNVGKFHHVFLRPHCSPWNDFVGCGVTHPVHPDQCGKPNQSPPSTDDVSHDPKGWLEHGMVGITIRKAIRLADAGKVHSWILCEWMIYSIYK